MTCGRDQIFSNRWRKDTQPMAADYSVYGGLYRNVWLLETDPVCIDPLTDGADGVAVEAYWDLRRQAPAKRL